MDLNYMTFKQAILNKNKEMKIRLERRFIAEKKTLLPLYKSGYNVRTHMDNIIEFRHDGVDGCYLVSMRDTKYNAADAIRELDILNKLSFAYTKANLVVLQVVHNGKEKLFVCGMLKGTKTLVGVKASAKLTIKMLEEAGMGRTESGRNTYLWYPTKVTNRGVEEFLKLLEL
jgi:hypothetical protein